MSAKEPGHSQLTEREMKIVLLIAAGRSVRAIAEQLSLREQVVQAHLDSAARKFQAKNLAETVLHALRQGDLTVVSPATRQGAAEPPAEGATPASRMAPSGDT